MPPNTTPHPARLLSLGFVWLCIALALTTGTAPRAHAESDDTAPTPEVLVEVFTSAWQRPFWSHSAWVAEMSFGGGGLGGQMARVLDDGGLHMMFNMGWRLGLVSLEAPLTIQSVESSVVDDISLVSWGVRARLHLPLFGGSVRLLGGAGVHATWATLCEDDGYTAGEEEGGYDCAYTPNDPTGFGDYTGHTWEVSAGAAVPALSMWSERDGVHGLELLLSVEYRRLWHDLRNDTLARTMRGHIDAVTVSLGVEFMFTD